MCAQDFLKNRKTIFDIFYFETYGPKFWINGVGSPVIEYAKQTTIELNDHKGKHEIS